MAEETTSTVQSGAESAAAEQTSSSTANTQAQTNGDTAASTASESKIGNLEELIQRAVDRATNKLGNENKKLRGQIDELKKAKLSDDELKQLEIQEKEKEIAEREQRLAEKENRLLAIKAIKEIGLDDGSDASLALVDFVMADDEAGIKERVKTFDALVKRFVQAEVDRVFKSNGRTPGKGTSAASETEKNDSIAVQIGQKAAKANKAAQSTLDYYIGGKK